MRSLENLSKNELYELAKSKNIKGRSKMSKEELINSLKQEINMEQLVEQSKFDPVPDSNIGYEYKEQKTPVVTPKAEDYPLPQTYDYDMIMFLPIDAKRAYVCWELTRAKLEEFIGGDNINNLKLTLRLVTKNIGELSKVKVGLFGNYFFVNHLLEDQEAWTEIGIENQDGFKPILVSNSFKMPCERISDKDDIVYMTVKSHIEKIIHLSLSGFDGHYSSLDIYKRLEKQISSTNNSQWR
ncbi:MAG: DUF4912 domain-containing protein [Calditerrivibrio sp.]|nr:DUF4912 domain-containing protein [Calditerrivibrio sp.]